VEVLSAVAIAWQFASPDPERREKTALRVIAISFFALAVYVTTEAVLSLTGVREPEHSSVGIVLAALSLVVMPFLSWFERRCGRELGSASAVADSKQTLMCSYLSAALLVGLVLNSLLDWTWADPVASLTWTDVARRFSATTSPSDPKTEIAALVHPEHYRKVTEYIKIGKGEARLVAGGERPELGESGAQGTAVGVTTHGIDFLSLGSEPHASRHPVS